MDLGFGTKCNFGVKKYNSNLKIEKIGGYMKQLKRIYHQYNEIITKYIFPVILFLYPFLTVNQGVDVSDSTYSFSNFLFFERMEGMWVVSTYVSNVVGWLLTKLPFGNTLLGMKIYATFFISATALLVYFVFQKWMPSWIAFVGELIALGFCWIPAGILYNYLSYFLFTLGAVLLYQGLVEEKDKLLLMAGIALGINVFVRIPNLTEMALIVGLWYYLASKRQKINVIIEKTVKCLIGYLIGLAIPLVGVICQFGFSGIVEMIQGLSNVGSADDTYSIWSMIMSVVHAYQRTSKWVLLMILGIAMGMAMFFCFRGKWESLKKITFIAGLLVLLRFLWGRGMFSFRYYEDYSSMYEWGMIALYLVWIAAIYMLVSNKNSLEEKLWAVIVMVITLVTPLGSNNYTFQNMNNFFVIIPFAFYTYVKIFRRKAGVGLISQITFPWKAMAAMLWAMIIIQSVGFHSQFVFRDGMDGSKRNYKFEEPKVLAGMHTTGVNGDALQDLLQYLEEKELKQQEIVLYGDCPGLSFLLNKPFAIGTSWPDLASYPYETFVQDLDELENSPMVIIRNVSTGGEQSILKKEYLTSFMNTNEYVNIYNNGTYGIYVTQKEMLE